MLGHNPATLNRLKNLKNTLESSTALLEGIIRDPSKDPDLSDLKTMIKDALQIAENQSPTKPETVYRKPLQDTLDVARLGPNVPRDK